MFTRAACISLLLISSAGFYVRAQNPPPAPQQTASKRKTESFWHMVLRISGIAESPSTLKGPGDEVVRGQIWIAEIASRKTRKLTDTDGFRSPVFIPGGSDILALKAGNVVRVPFASGKPANLFAIAGITKLVGFSLDDPDKVLVLTRDAAGHPGVALLSLSGGKLDPLSYEPSSSEDRHMVEHLSSWDRAYGDTSVYINQQTKSGMSGTLSWTDVFLRAGAGAPIDVSNCDGVNCGQPSLSADRKLVAFVKAGQD